MHLVDVDDCSVETKIILSSSVEHQQFIIDRCSVRIGSEIPCKVCVEVLVPSQADGDKSRKINALHLHDQSCL